MFLNKVSSEYMKTNRKHKVSQHNLKKFYQRILRIFDTYIDVPRFVGRSEFYSIARCIGVDPHSAQAMMHGFSGMLPGDDTKSLFLCSGLVSPIDIRPRSEYYWLGLKLRRDILGNL